MSTSQAPASSAPLDQVHLEGLIRAHGWVLQSLSCCGVIPAAAPPQAQSMMLLLPALHASLAQQLGAVDAARGRLEGVPAAAPYIPSLAALEPVYAALPQPAPSALAVQAQAELEAVVRDVQQVRGSGSGWRSRAPQLSPLQSPGAPDTAALPPPPAGALRGARCGAGGGRPLAGLPG